MNSDFQTFNGDELLSQVGQDNLARVDQMLRWLRDGSMSSEGPAVEYECRYGSSLVCRGEASLLGLSSPRFAVRAKSLDADFDFGFLSIRRLGRLFLSASQKEICVNDESKPEPVPVAQFVSQNNMVVADSMLVPPKRLDQYSFMYASSNFANAYGEEFENATPYMQAFQLGGGVCAQACAWMVSAAVAGNVKTLHGPAEISCIAEMESLDVNGPHEVDLSGMTLAKLSRYFRQIEANAPVHYVKPSISSRIALLKFVIRSYLACGIPVIAAVDFGRLNGVASSDSEVRGDSIFSRNEFVVKGSTGHKYMPMHHAVVIIGSDDQGETVVFHDPSSYPFVVASVDDLIKCRTYAELGENTKNISFLVDGNLDSQFRFQPVLPDEVRLPLTTWGEDTGEFLGLAQLYGTCLLHDEAFWSQVASDDLGPEELPVAVSDTHVRLLYSERKNKHAEETRMDRSLSSLPLQEAEWIKGHVQKLNSQYVWMQLIELEDSKLFVFWDATKAVRAQVKDFGDPTKKRANVGDGLILSLVRRDSANTLEEIYSFKGEDDLLEKAIADLVEVPKTRTKKFSITPKILTSAFPKRFLDSLNALREQLVDRGDLDSGQPLLIELYAVMESDLDGRDALTCLGDFEFLNEWWIKIKEFLDKSMIQVDGIASYIPEATSPHDVVKESAVQALAGLQKLGQIINDGEDKHSVPYIEVVGGSIFGNITIPNDSDGWSDKFVLEIESRSVNLKRLYSSLQAATVAIRSDEAYMHRDVIPFALELEPGPGMVLCSLDAMSQSLRKLQRDQVPALLNVDFSHFHICGTDNVATLSRSGFLCQNVANCHFSGRGIAHTADVEVEDLTQEERIALSEMYTQLSPLFSREEARIFGTIELEAAASSDIILGSYRTLRNFL